MNTVRAKFKVSSITRRMGSRYEDGKTVNVETQTVELWPVSGNSPENKTFFASTPTGKIELGMVNAEAIKLFELEKEYYLDFTPANQSNPTTT